MDDEWETVNNNPLEDFDDEDEDVKDCWEDEEEEKKDEEKPPAPVVEVKQTKKQTKAQKHVPKIESEAVKLTEEEMAAEKLRIKKEQEQSDLSMALETTFSGSNIHKSNDKLLKTIEDFREFINALDTQFQSFNKKPEYYSLVEQHIRNICASMPSSDLKNIRSTVGNLCVEKQKMENAEKSKKTKSKSKKATLKIKNDKTDDFSLYNDYGDYGDYDDDDNFM